MKLKVNHNELMGVKNTLEKDSTALLQCINDLLGQVEELKKSWQGEPSDIFCKKVDNYLNYLKIVPEKYESFATLIENADNSYKEADTTFADKMKKGVVKHE